MLRYDIYYRYAELTQTLQEMAERRPDLVRLESLGQSHEGRQIWCATVTRFSTGHDRHKPALWIDGNIHSTEVSATTACLQILERLLADTPDVQELLDTRTFYVVPRVNPDGPELALAERPVFLRSSTRPYPFDEEPVEGLHTEDLDGDGRILSMRIPDPDGPWKVCPEEPRLLVRRDPTDREGPFYRLLPEGRLVQGPGDTPAWDGVTLKVAYKKQQLDLNRNFPAHWRGESEQPGAGPFPTSEPEVRACVAFLADHSNICHAITFHTFSGVLLRPYSMVADEEFPVEDLEVYKLIGEKGQELTGYPALSVFHDFRYHSKEVITGTFDDWAYDHRGLLAWTVEIWSPHRQAGLTDGFSLPAAGQKARYRFIDWFDRHPLAEEIQMLKWSDEKLGGRGYEDWRPFDHPDLGPVEIGGWDMPYAFRNPPPEFLEAELKPLTEWVVWQAHTTPRLALHSQEVTPLGDGHYRLQVVVQNKGWLPTYVTKKALQRKACRGLVAELELGEGASLVSGQVREELGQLEGVAYKPTSPLWRIADPTDDRLKLSWVVRARAGATARITVRHERAGRLEQDYVF